MKKLAIALIIAAGLFACEKEEIKPGPKPGPVSPSMVIQGEFQVGLQQNYQGSGELGVKIRSIFEGLGEVNIMSPAALELNYESLIRPLKGVEEHQPGTFRLWNEAGDEIFGDCILLEKREDLIFIEARIVSGIAEFRSVSGQMTVRLLRKNGNEYTAVISGKVYGLEPDLTI